MPETLLSLDTLTKSIFASREGFEVAQEDLTDFVRSWSETDFLDGRTVKARVLILRTRGCTWDYQHGCTMCGYFVDTAHRKVTAEQLLAQWTKAEALVGAEEAMLKIYTGGNFLDDKEVFPEVQEAIVRAAAPRFRKIVVECRPEYCTPERLSHLGGLAREGGSKLEVAIGLESSSRLVCDQAINKGYAFEEFREAALRCRAAGVGVKAYLLLKPPFLTEDETVEDVVQSIRDAAPFSDVVSVNPTNVQKFTLVESLYDQGEYRPAWLWSILEVLERGKALAGTAVLKSDPVGGGTRRGAHNCGECDDAILKRLDQYNATQDIAFVREAQSIECRCKAEYRAVRRLEGFLVGGCFR